jgi:hypothetical protein
MLRADNTTYPSTSTVLLYLLHWVFDSEGYARLATPEELDIQISLGAKDQEIDIKQRSCTTFHRTLGVDENPAGIYKTEYTHIVTKGQKYYQSGYISSQYVRYTIYPPLASLN